MRIPTNNISPLIFSWCILYVLALLSLYTHIADRGEAATLIANNPSEGRSGSS